MRELVEDGHADLLTQLLGVREGLLEWDAVDRDLVRKEADTVAAFGQRHAVVEAEDVGLLGVLVLDDDGDVPERRGDVGRQRVECRTDVIVEGHRSPVDASCRFGAR